MARVGPDGNLIINWAAVREGAARFYAGDSAQGICALMVLARAQALEEAAVICEHCGSQWGFEPAESLACDACARDIRVAAALSPAP